MSNDIVVDVPSHIETNFEWPQASAEDAYWTYMGTGMRSLRRTADILGIPHGTVLSWSSRHNWAQRARDTDIEMTMGVAEAAAAATVAQQFRNIEYLAKLRDDEEADHKDRIRATNILMGEFKDVSVAVAGKFQKDDSDMIDEDELEKLAQSPEGVAQLLARSRARLQG